MTPNWQNKIDEVMDYFDFDRVFLVMQVLNWQWEGKVPESVQAVKKQARYLMTECINKNYPRIATCGFVVEIDGTDYLSLRFELTEYESFDIKLMEKD